MTEPTRKQQIQIVMEDFDILLKKWGKFDSGVVSKLVLVKIFHLMIKAAPNVQEVMETFACAFEGSLLVEEEE
tara:strand:+ start:742 stop:960 length:219 start_codon:yes stop_codon:yes gene_type:complete